MIHVYHMASLNHINEIPYQFALLADRSMNCRPQTDHAFAKVGPPVSQIEFTNNHRFIKIQYADSSFVVVDRTQNSPREAICGHQQGHF